MSSNLTSLRGLLAWLLFVSLFPIGPAFAATGGENTDNAYVGSETCRECHATVYSAWRTTSHSFSMRTPQQAQAVHLSLPPPVAAGQKQPQWSDISAVFGGRNRLTYIDNSGAVIQPTFDVRLQRWDRQFPNGQIESCWTCHATGVIGLTDTNPGYSEHSLEQTIGCEACHGPGGRHSETFEPEDIIVDMGSRTCGRCHTGTGRVLPRIDHHQTHDFVQQWHQDAHVRGLADHSVSAQCASCHSPADAQRVAHGDPSSLVFSEQKKDIGCASCHDPHRMTNSAHAIDSGAVAKPQLTVLSLLAGRDGDFTTADHDVHQDTESSCRACHRGADQVVLNHGDATCVDCHNAFQRSRGRETKVTEDPNHAGISCRGCHSNGDHLLTIVSNDARFLNAKLVHNLGKLPASALKHFELNGASYGTSGRNSVAFSPDEAPVADRQPTIEITKATPRAGVIEADLLTHHLSEAVRFLDEDKHDQAVRQLQLSAKVDSSGLLFAVPFDPESLNRGESAVKQLLDRVEAQPLLVNSATEDWLRALGAALKGDADAVIQIGKKIEPEQRAPPLNVLIALAHASRGDSRAGVRLLEQDASKGHLARVATAVLEFRRNRHDAAREHLESVLAVDPENAVAHYVHGLVLAGEGQYEAAVNALSKAVTLVPQWQDAWLKLGYLLIRAQATNHALSVLQQSAKAWPGEHAMRYRLGSLYKLLADQMRYQLIATREAPRPRGVTLADWRRNLADRDDQIRRIASIAHAEYTYAQQLQPSDHRTQWQRAEALRIMGREADALQLFETLAAREPNQWALQYRAGLLQLNLSKPKQAAARLVAAHQLQPDQADVLGALGYVYLQLDEPKRASERLELARVFEPFNPAIHHNLGVAYARSNAPADAERVWRRGLELATFPLPRVHLTHFNLGLLYYRQGKIAAARLELERALFAFPDFEPALRLHASLEKKTSASAVYLLHAQADMFGEISTISGFDLAP